MDIETPLRRARKFVSDHKRGVALALILPILAVIFLGREGGELDLYVVGYFIGGVIVLVMPVVIVGVPLVGGTYLIVNGIMNRDSPTKGGLDRVSRVIWLSFTIYGTLFLIFVLNDTVPEYLAPSLVALFILGIVMFFRARQSHLSVSGGKLTERNRGTLLQRLKNPSTLPSWSGFFRLDNIHDRSRRRDDDEYPVFGALYAVIQKLLIPLLYGAAFFLVSHEMWASFFRPEMALVLNFVASGFFAWFIFLQTLLYVQSLAEGAEGKMAPEGPDQGKQRPTLGALIRYAVSLFLVTATASLAGYLMYDSFLRWQEGSSLVLALLVRYASGYITAFFVYTTFREAFIHAWRGRSIGTQMLQWFVLGTVPFIIATGVNQFLTSSTPLIPPLAAGISILFGVFGYVAVAHVIQLQWPSETHKRGREESTFEKARKAAESINAADGLPGIFMGGLEVPWKDRTSHFAFAGTTGSGKSTQIRLLQQDVLPLVGRNVDQRALIYDAKLDAYSQLEGVRLNTDPITLNPFDKRSPGLNLSSDIVNPASALQIATTLFYDRPGSNEFFTFTARRLGAGVLQAFILRKLRGEIAEWTFSDWCRVMTDPDHITHVLTNTPETRKILKSLQDPETISNVMSTIGSYITHYEIIGALWDRKDEERDTTREEPVSIKKWASDQKGSILIMSRTDEATEAVDALNAVIFTLAAQYSLALPNSTQRSTWFFLDEVAEGKKLPYLTKLALKGRSKGCCIVIGFQDIDGVRLTYGEKEGNQIVAMCAYRWLGKIDSDVTQVWASNQLGTKEVELPVQSVQKNVGNQTTSTQYQSKIVPIVIPSEFGTFPKADYTVNGIKGWYVMPNPIGAFENTLPPQLLTARIPEPAKPDDKNAPVDFDPIDDPMAQYLDDWSDEQRDYYLGTQKPALEAPAREEIPREKERVAEEAGDILDFETETTTTEGKVINGVDFSQKATAPKPRPKKKPNLNL